MIENQTIKQTKDVMETQCTKHQQTEIRLMVRGTVTARTSLTRALRSSTVEAVAVVVRTPGHSISTAIQAIALATSVSALSSPQIDGVWRVCRKNAKVLTHSTKQQQAI